MPFKYWGITIIVHYQGNCLTSSIDWGEREESVNLSLWMENKEFQGPRGHNNSSNIKVNGEIQTATQHIGLDAERRCSTFVPLSGPILPLGVLQSAIMFADRTGHGLCLCRINFIKSSELCLTFKRSDNVHGAQSCDGCFTFLWPISYHFKFKGGKSRKTHIRLTHLFQAPSADFATRLPLSSSSQGECGAGEGRSGLYCSARSFIIFSFRAPFPANNSENERTNERAMRSGNRQDTWIRRKKTIFPELTFGP